MPKKKPEKPEEEPYQYKHDWEENVNEWNRCMIP